MGNLNPKAAKIAAAVVGGMSFIYGLIPTTIEDDLTGWGVSFDEECGSVLFPGPDAGQPECDLSRIPAGVLWIIIVASVATVIYLSVKGSDEKN